MAVGNIKAKYIFLGEKNKAETKKSQADINLELKAASDYLIAIKQVFSGYEIPVKKDSLKFTPTVMESNMMNVNAAHVKGFDKDEILALSECHLENSKKILNCFKTHSLFEQSGAALMDRVDRKFLIPVSLLTDMFSELSPFYSVLSENQKKIFEYKTHYFDSEQDLLYLQHQNGLLNRYKIRTREYVSSGKTFLEVKQKTNHFRTQKNRYLLSGEFKSRNINSLLTPLTDHLFPPLYKKLLVKYERFTLKHKRETERITIDVNLAFEPIEQAHHLSDATASKLSQSRYLPEIAIIELKQENHQRKTEFEQLAKKYALREMDFSKYCMGRILTQVDENQNCFPEQIKYNRFKTSLLMLKQVRESFYTQQEQLVDKDSINI